MNFDAARLCTKYSRVDKTSLKLPFFRISKKMKEAELSSKIYRARHSFCYTSCRLKDKKNMKADDRNFSITKTRELIFINNEPINTSKFI